MNLATGLRASSLRTMTMLIALPILSLAYHPSARADCEQFDASAEIGSVRDYVSNSYPGAHLVPAHVPLLGLSVIPAKTKMASGGEVLGLAVTKVDSTSPAEDAGILGQRTNPGHIAEKIGAGVVLTGAALIFPPAAIGLVFINKMGSNQKYDLIVAVDSERTRSLFDLETSLRLAQPGQIVYLTVVRDGRPLQFRITVPSSGALPVS